MKAVVIGYSLLCIFILFTSTACGSRYVSRGFYKSKNEIQKIVIIVDPLIFDRESKLTFDKSDRRYLSQSFSDLGREKIRAAAEVAFAEKGYVPSYFPINYWGGFVSDTAKIRFGKNRKAKKEKISFPVIFAEGVDSIEVNALIRIEQQVFSLFDRRIPAASDRNVELSLSDDEASKLFNKIGCRHLFLILAVGSHIDAEEMMWVNMNAGPIVVAAMAATESYPFLRALGVLIDLQEKTVLWTNNSSHDLDINDNAEINWNIQNFLIEPLSNCSYKSNR